MKRFRSNIWPSLLSWLAGDTDDQAHNKKSEDYCWQNWCNPEAKPLLTETLSRLVRKAPSLQMFSAVTAPRLTIGTPMVATFEVAAAVTHQTQLHNTRKIT
jgi:hypothetical protein